MSMVKLAYRPRPYHPPVTLGDPVSRALGQPFEQYLGIPVVWGDVIRLVFHGGAAYMGMYIGAKEEGLLSALGWIIGLGQSVGFVLDVVSLLEKYQSQVASEASAPISEAFAPDVLRLPPETQAA